MPRKRLNEVKEIPLHLLPVAIARQIRKTGDRIYRISVKRTHWHRYNLSVRTRTVPRELAPPGVAVFSQDAPDLNTGSGPDMRCRA
jgi:hypothetical protein